MEHSAHLPSPLVFGGGSASYMAAIAIVRPTTVGMLLLWILPLESSEKKRAMKVPVLRRRSDIDAAFTNFAAVPGPQGW